MINTNDIKGYHKRVFIMKLIKTKIYIPFTFLLVLFMITSCGKDLGINPQQSIDASIALKTPANVKDALYGAYSEIQQTGVFGSDYDMYSALLSSTNQMFFSGSYQDYLDVYNKRQVANNAFTGEMWDTGYNAINICNNVLSSISVLDKGDQNTIQGEAEFIRGVVLFELVKFYGLPWDTSTNGKANSGVPIVLKPTLSITKDANVKRATVTQDYAQIIKDLKDAESKLPKSNSDGRATTYAASAFLSEVYLEKDDYSNALQEANKVIQSGAFSLVANYADEFNNSSNTSEDIFDIQENSQSNPVSDNWTFYASLPGVGRGDMDIDSTHFITMYQNGDARKNIYYVGTGLKPGRWRCGKWKVRFTNKPIIRLAEMYLTRAECNFRLSSGVGDTPLNDINKIRERATLPDTNAVSLSSILKQRYLELAWEGKRLDDVKRLHLNVGSLSWNANKLILPIPQREMDVNSNMVQNPGYD